VRNDRQQLLWWDLEQVRGAVALSAWYGQNERALPPFFSLPPWGSNINVEGGAPAADADISVRAFLGKLSHNDAPSAHNNINRRSVQH